MKMQCRYNRGSCEKAYADVGLINKECSYLEQTSSKILKALTV